MKTKNNETKRAPDYETESFRAWSTEKGEFKDLETSEGIEVDIGNETIIKLVGFTEIRKAEVLIGAYKLRTDKNMIIYYIPKDADEDDRNKFLEVLSGANQVFGFALNDVWEQFKSIKNELNSMEKKFGDKKNDIK